MRLFKQPETEKARWDAEARLEVARTNLGDLEREAGIGEGANRTSERYRDLVFQLSDVELRKQLISAHLEVDSRYGELEEAVFRRDALVAARARGKTWANRHYWKVALVGAGLVYVAFREEGEIGALAALAFVFPAQVAYLLDEIKGATLKADELDADLRERRDIEFKRRLGPTLFDHLESVTGVPNAVRRKG